MIRAALIASVIAAAFVVVTTPTAEAQVRASTLFNAWSARTVVLRRGGGGTNVSPN
jgi:hypothetical protein